MKEIFDGSPLLKNSILYSWHVLILNQIQNRYAYMYECVQKLQVCLVFRKSAFPHSSSKHDPERGPEWSGFTSTGQLINEVEWLIDSKVADESLERFHMIKSNLTVTYDYFLVDKSGQHIRGCWVTCTLVDVLGTWQAGLKVYQSCLLNHSNEKCDKFFE